MKSTEPPHTAVELNELLIALFKEMDAEATPVEGNYPTGLWWYVGHLDRKSAARKKNNTEVAWTRRLAEMLEAAGWVAIAEHRYKGESAKRCDVVVDFGHHRIAWIEVKGAWREVFDPGRPNSSFVKHLRDSGRDVDKLNLVEPKAADLLGFVLIGFDRAELPITDKHLEIIRARMRDDSWVESHVMWDVQQRVAFRTHIWVWSRENVSSLTRTSVGVTVLPVTATSISKKSSSPLTTSPAPAPERRM